MKKLSIKKVLRENKHFDPAYCKIEQEHLYHNPDFPQFSHSCTVKSIIRPDYFAVKKGWIKAGIETEAIYLYNKNLHVWICGCS